MTHWPPRTQRTISVKEAITTDIAARLQHTIAALFYVSPSNLRLSHMALSCVALLGMMLWGGGTSSCDASDSDPQLDGSSLDNRANKLDIKYQNHIPSYSIPWQTISDCQQQEIAPFRIFVRKAGFFEIVLNSCQTLQHGEDLSLSTIQSKAREMQVQVIRSGFIQRARVRRRQQFSTESLPQRVTGVVTKIVSASVQRDPNARGYSESASQRLKLTFPYYQRGTPRLRHLFVEVTPAGIVRVANVPHAFVLSKFAAHDQADIAEAAPLDIDSQLNGDSKPDNAMSPKRSPKGTSQSEGSAEVSGQSGVTSAPMDNHSEDARARSNWDNANRSKNLPPSRRLAVDYAITKFPDAPFIPLSSALATRSISVTVQTDESFEAAKGANDNLLAMIGGADAIYRDNFNTTLNLDVIVSSRDNIPLRTTAPDASSRLRSYITDTMPLQPQKTDVSFLVTKKDLVGSLVGLAALGGACSQVAGAVIQSINPAVDYIILAHELGHLLSASHTSSGLMSSSISLSSPTTSFATESLVQISSFLDSRISCFAQDGSVSDNSLLPPSPALPPSAPEASNLGKNQNPSNDNVASNSNESRNVPSLVSPSPLGSPAPLPTTRPTPRPRLTPKTTTPQANTEPTPARELTPSIRLARRGSYIEGEINLPESVDPSCAVDLKGLIANSSTDRMHFETLSTIPVASDNLSFSLRWPNPRRGRMLPTSIRKLPTLKLRAFLKCPSQRVLRSRAAIIRGSDRPDLSVSAQSFVMSLIRTTLRMTR